MKERDSNQPNTKIPFWAKATAVVLGAAAIAAGCSDGRGDDVTECDGSGTPIAATFQGDKEYQKQTDPAFLANFARKNPAIIPRDADNDFGYDDVDQVGEIACKDDELIVLTSAGATLSSIYSEAVASEQK